ncbi:21892_t:CDS:10 [Entrophospora sp. SA101]|nr:21892_t:CDS:10 [Entrophospora sp. SA101]
MSFHVYQILEFGPLQPNEQVFENFTDSRTGAPSTTEDLNTIHQTSSNEITAQHPTHPTPSGEIVPHPIISWEPSQKFIRLLYPEKAKWTQKIENFEYPLIQANLNLRLIENPNPPENQIQQIPLFKRKYLSLIYLHSSLGWTSNLGAYSEYWSIVGTFGSLIAGANWLADNNPYLREYKNALVTNSSGSVSSSPTATHLPDDETAPEFQSGDIIVPHQNFPSEIHNEDSHYSRLIAGFIKNDDIQVKYIVTDPPSVRSKCILPFSRINLDYDELYWKDLIEKYLAQPNGEPFDNITYKDYIEKYDIKLSAINSKHGELYFYQKLLLRVPARSEEDLIGTYETYRDHYLARFPEEFGNSIKSDQQNQHHQTINMLDQYINLIENLLYSLQSLLTQDIKGIIRSQLENIKILPPIVPNNTGSGKSILINLFAKKFLELNKNFLLMAPTGVAAVNIQGQTIHSALRIWSHVSMVRASLLTFISEMFSGIYQIFAPFGGINVILIGDLAQLPPINGHPVYKSPIWKVFYPIFLRHSHHQQNDPFFYNVLQKIRLGNKTPSVWQFLQEKANQSLSLEMSSLHTSYIVGFRKSASYINEIICNHLPALNNKFMISEAIDCVDGRMVDNSYEHLIKNKTNLPGSLCLQLGAKVIGIYRMILLGVFYLPRSHHDFGVFQRTIELLTQFKVIVNQTSEICIQSLRGLQDTRCTKHDGSTVLSEIVKNNESSSKSPPHERMTRSSYHSPIKIPLF